MVKITVTVKCTLYSQCSSNHQWFIQPSTSYLFNCYCLPYCFLFHFTIKAYLLWPWQYNINCTHHNDDSSSQPYHHDNDSRGCKERMYVPLGLGDTPTWGMIIGLANVSPRSSDTSSSLHIQHLRHCSYSQTHYHWALIVQHRKVNAY